LLTIWFVSKFGKRPMHLFGLLGTLMFMIGFVAAFYIGTSKLMTVFVYHEPSPLVTGSPWFYIALTTMVLGTQLFLAGFIGELILRSKKNIANYQISEKI